MASARRVSRFNVFRPEPSVMRVPHGPGWALVGDAGHYMDPTTGQGMANAFLSAQLLSDAVIAGDDLAGYHHRRDELLGEMHAITGDLSQLAWSNDEVLGYFGRFRAAVGATLAAVDAGLSPPATSGLPSTAHAVRA
jgi:flavin-dependent dehydrogenase